MKRNSSQKRAIAHLSGPMMVLAGPGSGKTSVIVERTAYLVREGKAEPSSILVVTFSRAAARELKERFLQLGLPGAGQVTFGTFHGIYYGILKHTYRLGPENILSEEEKYELLREITLELGQDMAMEGDLVEDVAKEISMVKEERIALEHYYSASCPDEAFRRIYLAYRQQLRERRKLDFDDMLLYCYELLSKRKDVLDGWRKRFRYIMVDEFQDINRIQYEILGMLAAPENNLFIVGDDDQSIYHFRGARPEIMLNFSRDYPAAERVLLDVNYRCSGQILKTAMKVIGCNKTRFLKKLSTPNGEGEPVRIRVYENPREEYLETVQELKKRLDAGEGLEDTAILLRTNQEAEGLVRALMEYQVPFTMKEQLPNLFSHWIFRNVKAYLSMAAGDRSRKTFLDVMNRPNRYISREALQEKTVDFGRLKEYYKDKDWMWDRIATLETHLRILSSLAPYGAVNFVRKAVGYEEYLREYANFRNIRPEELIEILDRILESAKGMKSLKQWEDYIEAYTRGLKEQAKKQKGSREGVTVSTLHGAKGLEFDQVYILNVNEGSIPYKKAVLKEALEEERRLFYVGMTRAREHLTLCSVRHQYEKEREPSRFLMETGLWKQ